MNNWIESDWALRISSVIISVVLWLIVTHSFPFQQNEESTLRIDGVPVEIRYDKDNYVLQGVNQQQVQLTLSGGKKDLQSIPSYQVYVDLHNVKSGQYQQVPIQVNGLPKDIQVKVFPAHLRVFLDKKVQKGVPVRVQIAGKLPTGYEIDQTTVTPSHVLLKGTESQVKNIHEAVAVIDVKDAQFPFEKWVKLRMPNKDVTFSPESVKVTMTVRKPSKTLPLTVNVDKNPPVGYQLERIEWEPKEITLSGEQADLHSITHYPPLLLDLSRVRSNQTISMEVPTIHNRIEVQPKEIKVKVFIKEE